MKRQWHQMFAKLLGMQLGVYYEIGTEVPVSDLPRLADYLVVRRSAESPPFRGLWNYLTDVNVIEFKGRTDDASPEHLEKFMHVGTGITHRLNEKRWAVEQPSLNPSTVSFWYIAPVLGETFRRAAIARVSNWEYEGGGLYRGRAWGHPVFFVSARDLVVEEDTVPLWLVEGDPAPRAVGEFVAHHQTITKQFAASLAELQPALWQEVRDMFEFPDLIDFEAVARHVASDPRVLEHIPPEEVFKAVGIEKTLDALLTQVSGEQLQELLKRRQPKSPPPSEGTPP